MDVSTVAPGPASTGGPTPPDAGDLAQRYLTSLLAGKRREAVDMIVRAVESEGVDVRVVYLDVLQVALREIGRLWQNNQVTIAQEHFSTAVTQLAMSRLYTHIFSTEKHGGVLVATCVGGELHEVGVRMVSDFFELDGWDTFFLGSNMPLSGIIEEVKDRGAELLAVSATLRHHVPQVRLLIQQVRAVVKPGPKVLVGGYPFLENPDLWQQLGADGFAIDAAEAIRLGNRLTGRDMQ